MSKITWRVSDKPTGRYRSFEKRGWPSASYEDGSPAAHIYCDDAYEPSNVREGKYSPLTLMVADHSRKSWKWRKAKRQFATLHEAQIALERILQKYPELRYNPNAK